MTGAPSLHPLDPTSFEELYRRTFGRVHALARRLVGRERAEEATQEVFLKAWAKRASFRGDAQASTWLRTVARNELINLSLRIDPAATLDADEVAHRGPRANDDLRMDLERALPALPLGARRVFVLFDIEGMAHDEIAARLGISVGTSKSQLHRARALLRSALFSWSEAQA